MKIDLINYFDLLEKEDLLLYFLIADFMYELGYKAKRAKTKDISYVFLTKEHKKHILKFSIRNNKPEIKMKFFASSNYSNLFSEAIKITIERFNLKYTGCYGCGQCKDQLEGYHYVYPNGNKYFRCGKELITIHHFEFSNIDEIFSLLKTQHEYHILNQNK